ARALDAARRARAVAEFEEWKLIAAHHRRRVAEIDRSDAMVLTKELARREITLDIAQALHITEYKVWAIISEAETLRERTPAVWEAFRTGDLDAARATAIADTAERLVERESWTKLEEDAVAYAVTHTVNELRCWLRRFRA